MNYPLISEYISSILSAEDNFKELTNLRPVLDDEGQPIMSSGNFAVVFKMKDEQTGKFYALKCFLKDQEERAESYQKITEELEYVSSAFLTSVRYIDKELFVDTQQSSETEYPVLLMGWVEGKTLDVYAHEHISDTYAIELLAYQFGELASWLMTQSFAHGDLKPDNILVTFDVKLVLVDYDGMYVPSMKGEKARELGSPDFRHPLRSKDNFNEYIDDFALASISLSLKAIALQPELLQEYGASDRLLFSAEDYQDLATSKVLHALQDLLNHPEVSTLYSLFILAWSKQNLSSVSFRLFNLEKPKKTAVEILSTEVTDEDLADAWEDEYGVKYSKDGKRLLKAICPPTSYIVKHGINIICNAAFEGCISLKSVAIPNSVTSIGNRAFSYCCSLESVVIPNSVTNIGNRAFDNCESLQSVVIPNSVTNIENRTFEDCYSLESIVIPNSVTSIGDSAFSSCTSLQSVIIPNSVTSIGNNAFQCCESLQSINIPNSVSSIGDSVFAACYSLKSIVIPDSVISIDNYAFYRCTSLESLTIPQSVIKLGSNPFVGVKNIKCQSKQFTIKNGVLFTSDIKELIGYYSTSKNYSIPDSVLSIGNGAFGWCSSLQSIVIPNSVTSIGNHAFWWCSSLQSVVIPNSVISIGNHAFWICRSLQSVVIPNSIISIGDSAFTCCDFLQSINIPKGTYEKFTKLLPDYKDKLKEQ